MNLSPTFGLFLAPDGTICLISYQMLHCVHQLVANFVCLQFGAEQVEYSEFFLELFC